jgi:hypothetical protein
MVVISLQHRHGLGTDRSWLDGHPASLATTTANKLASSSVNANRDRKFSHEDKTRQVGNH